MKKLGLVLLVLVILFTVLYEVNKKETDQDFLENQFSNIESLISKRDLKNEKVSQADVAWHLDHILKTINVLSLALENSNPSEFKSGFSMQKIFVFTTGRIPRGVAQSPEGVRPPNVIVTENLYHQLREAEKRVSTIGELDENTFFEHPFFKSLNRDQTRRFLEIHTNHHLKIIRDILED